MYIFHRLFKKPFLIVGLAIVAAAGSAQTPKSFDSPFSTKARGAAFAPSFDSEWASIDAFINAHAINQDAAAKAEIKWETQHGYYDWKCYGNGLGYPTESQLSAAMLYFDTSDSASYAAGLIIALANAQGH